MRQPRDGSVDRMVLQLRMKFGEPLPASVVARVEAETESDFERWTRRILRFDQLFDPRDGRDR